MRCFIYTTLLMSLFAKFAFSYDRLESEETFEKRPAKVYRKLGKAINAVTKSKQRSDLLLETKESLDILFWSDFHSANYDRIDELLVTLTNEYYKKPTDPVLAARIGWLHIWKLVEKGRSKTKANATITNHATLCKKYFTEANKLNPKEMRYLGFMASCTLIEGAIHGDQKGIQTGYFLMKDAILSWPEFNLFTSGYGLGRKEHDDPRFEEGLSYMFKTMDLCAGEKVDRSNPDFKDYSKKQFDEDSYKGKSRACWNSWKTPHNFEGFFLNLGDMLVKKGDIKTAKVAYKNAQYSKDYINWPYKRDLEKRLETLSENHNALELVKSFRQSDQSENDQKYMINSEFACMGCHQK